MAQGSKCRVPDPILAIGSAALFALSLTFFSIFAGWLFVNKDFVLALSSRAWDDFPGKPVSIFIGLIGGPGTDLIRTFLQRHPERMRRLLKKAWKTVAATLVVLSLWMLVFLWELFIAVPKKIYLESAMTPHLVGPAAPNGPDVGIWNFPPLASIPLKLIVSMAALDGFTLGPHGGGGETIRFDDGFHEYSLTVDNPNKDDLTSVNLVAQFPFPVVREYVCAK